MTPPEPTHPRWGDTTPLEVHAPPVMTHAVVRCRGRLWCFGDEDFRGQQQPNHAGRILQRGATHLRSEEHTSELQSRSDLVCRLLLEKKKKIIQYELHSTLRRFDETDVCTRC